MKQKNAPRDSFLFTELGSQKPYKKTSGRIRKIDRWDKLFAHTGQARYIRSIKNHQKPEKREELMQPSEQEVSKSIKTKKNKGN